jgi:hypothetical protein
MGQASSRPRPPALSSSTRVPDHSSAHSLNHNSDLSNQTTKRNKRRSILGTLRSPLRHSLNHQSTTTTEGDTTRTKTHRRWTLYGRRKPSEPARAPPEAYDEAQPDEVRSTTTADPKGKAKEDNPAVSTTELVGPTTAGPSSSDSSNTSQPSSGTATDLSSSSTSSSPTSRDPVAAALNHDPRTPLPTIAIQPDSTPEMPHDNPEPFDVMERPATPPDPAQAPPPEARRNFPAAGTLVVVQGVVHTSDVSQSNSSDPTDNTALHPASPVPTQGERPPRRRFSDLLTRPIRSRRSSYAAPESQSSETTVSTESENQDVSSATSETSQEQQVGVQEETPVPASRPLSLSPTSIEVLGTLLRYCHLS